MDLVLTEVNTGGYRAHRPNCKKIVDKEQFDPEELAPEKVADSKPCSSCKPKDEDFRAMMEAHDGAVPQAPAHNGEPVSEGDGTEPEVLDEVDEDGLESEFIDVFDDLGLEHPTDEQVADLIGDESLGLLGDEQEAAEALTAHEERKAPKPVPSVSSGTATPKPKVDDLKAEQATELLVKVFSHLDLTVPDPLVFPGFGKAVKTVDKQTVYLNSKGTADVRANSAEQAAAWVEEGLAERRGGNYVRVNVRAL